MIQRTYWGCEKQLGRCVAIGEVHEEPEDFSEANLLDLKKRMHEHRASNGFLVTPDQMVFVSRSFRDDETPAGYDTVVLPTADVLGAPSRVCLAYQVRDWLMRLSENGHFAQSDNVLAKLTIDYTLYWFGSEILEFEEPTEIHTDWPNETP